MEHADGSTFVDEEVALDSHGCNAACPGVFDDFQFALCLTHDVDRVYKTFQGPFHAVAQGRLQPLKTTWGNGTNPYWQFDTVTSIEQTFGVRSTFFFLEEKRLFSETPIRRWLSPAAWPRHLGNYTLTDPAIVEQIRRLGQAGWEIGLHGSYDSYREPSRLADEKATLEAVFGQPVTGCRQHYLNLSVPDTWRVQRWLGLRYDASLGSSNVYGFDTPVSETDLRVVDHVLRPFDDHFIVFPLTVMDSAVMSTHDTTDKASDAIVRLLREAKDRSAMMTVLWHPRLFNDREFPGYRSLYEHLLEEADRLGAWIGPVEDAYREIVTSECFNRHCA